MKILSSLPRHRRLSMLALLAIGAAACIPIRREASWPSITLLDNKDEILMAYDDRVVLVSAKDGKPLELRNADGEIRVDENGKPLIWQFGGPKSSPNQFYAAPVLVSDKTLLIPSYDDHIYEVDIASARSRTPDGTPLDGRVLSSPTLSDNTLYMGIERDMVALDSANFDVRWKLPTGQGVWSKPLVVGEALYFTSLDHKLYAVNAATGDVNWSLDLEGAAPESPILHDNRLYVGSFARKIFEISLQGDILSEYDTKDWVWGAPTIVDGVLYAADVGGMVYALNLTSKGLEERWAAPVSEKAIRTTPLVSGEYVVVGSRDHSVYWLDRTDGSIFFSRELAGEVLSDLLLIQADAEQGIDEPLVIASTLESQQYMTAFTLQNGEHVWDYSA